MKNKQSKKIFIALILTVLALVVVQGTLAAEKPTGLDKALEGGQTAIDEAFGGGASVVTSGGPLGGPFVYGLFQIINGLLTFTGVIFFLILIYGGYLWMMARGNEEQLTRAKRITREVIIGIIIIVLARIITEFILIQIGLSLKASSIAI